jgi:hypothetical protein
MRYALLLLLTLGPLLAQDFKLPADLEHLAKKATEVVDVNLDGKLLEFAGKFLSTKDPDEARAKNIIAGLKGIYVRAFEFEKEGEYSPGDVEAVRKQLKTPSWSRIVGVINKKGGENAEVYIKSEGDHVGGLVVVAAEPKELTIVQIVGRISLDDLSELGGHFGVPEVDTHAAKKPAAKD